MQREMAEERVVVVNGAAGGLGSHAVEQLSARGVCVVAVDLDAGRLEGLKGRAQTDGEIVTFAGDVTDEGAVRSFIELGQKTWGRLDGIYNNAAIQGLVGPFVDYPEEELWRVMRANFLSAWLGMKHAIPVFRRAGGGRIVNTGSSLAYRGWPEVPAYVSSKHALAGLTRTVAIEYAKDNIQANLLCPSSMATPMLDTVAANLAGGDLEEGLRQIAAMIPSGRIAPPDEVAAIAVWLLLDAPRHLSGVTLPVDAAETAG